jgi:hypothetical protein
MSLLSGPFAVDSDIWERAFALTHYLYPDSSMQEEVLDELQQMVRHRQAFSYQAEEASFILNRLAGPAWD